jgi:hypothetical protein
MIFLYSVEIPNYIKKIPISRSGRIKYYKKLDNIPKKYKNDHYIFKGNYLVDKDSGEKIIKRKPSGKPREQKISGQDIWRGINYHMRSKVASELKKYFYSYLSNVPVLDDELIYPLSVRLDFYDHINEGEDIDNMAFMYRKCLHDSLCGNVSFQKVENGTDKSGKPTYMLVPDRETFPPKIIDDRKEYIQDIPTRFFPINEDETPKIVIEVCSLKDEE